MKSPKFWFCLGFSISLTYCTWFVWRCAVYFYELFQRNPQLFSGFLVRVGVPMLATACFAISYGLEAHADWREQQKQKGDQDPS